MNTVFWHAPQTLIEQPESGSLQGRKAATELTLVYAGPYQACLDANPGYGLPVAGYPPQFRIESWSVQRLSGGRGRLTLTLTNTVHQAETEGPKYELDWVMEQVDILQAPKLRATLSDADIMDIQMWRAEPDLGLRAQFKYRRGETEQTLSASAQRVAKKNLPNRPVGGKI
ncbi:MAG: hypothetical protein N3B01_10625, partial [Verrucomicrobiae bacterium]|nr:hypothetical protein [Verrucomicrobiae bacterium]